MKTQIKQLISAAIRDERLWKLLDATVARGVDYARSERAKQEAVTRDALIEAARIAISPDLTVRNGPFRGMRYPERASVGSALVPKLLGSYERELQPVLEDILAREHSEIVDIGCAEGYYAVGLALRLPAARVFAYDTNAKAIALCRKMAELNGVTDRLVTGSFCDPGTLRSLPLTGRAIVVSDCEGYERELFTDAVVAFLAQHDVLIEVHDFLDMEISSLLRERFRATHSITAVQSVDDILKVSSYDYAELRDYDRATRRILLAEKRPAIMEWLYLTPLARSSPLAR